MRRTMSLLVAITIGWLAIGAAPATRPVRVEKDIPYVEHGDPAQILDIYLPETPPTHPQPLLIWIHGGGWSGGSKEQGPMKEFLAAGYIFASIEYRFSQKALFPAQIQDCQAAIRFLRANALKYAIDAEHVGVAGTSAGGHLVALVGTSGGKKAFPPVGEHLEQSDQVQAVCDFYGPTDFTTVARQAAEDTTVRNVFHFNDGDPYSRLIGARLDDLEKALAVSPVHYATKDSAPFLIIHGTADTRVPFAQSVELADVLQGAGVEVTLQKIPGGSHGGKPFWSRDVNQLMHRFFDKHLKGIDAKIEPVPESTFPTTRVIVPGE